MPARKRRGSAAFYTVLILFMFFILFPFFIMLMVAVKPTPEAIQYPPTIFPETLTFEHIRDIFNPKIFPFLSYFSNSFIISIISSIVSVFVGIFGGYSLSKLRFLGRAAINQSFYMVYMFSGILLVVPLFKIISGLGITNTRTALIITMVVQTLPTCIFMMKSYFDTVPLEIEEAGMVDGLNRVQLVFRIMIPLSMPGIVSVFVYAFMIAWNDYLFASTLLSSSPLFTLPIGLNTLFKTPDYVWGRMMAASLFTSLPIIVLYALSGRFIKGGATEGGVKG
jgi:multiple sugar transport system permease protein